LNQLNTLENVVLLDTTLLGKLLELDERHRIHDALLSPVLAGIRFFPGIK
jgi:hypothetical protein